jgi:uncharacterized membrane protein
LSARIRTLEDRPRIARPLADPIAPPAQTSPALTPPPPVAIAPPPVAAAPPPRVAAAVPAMPAAAAASRPAAPAPTAQSIEAQIGARWLLYIGVVAIVIGVGYFEKLAIDNDWINETARAIQGGLIGLALIYAGIRFTRVGYALYGQMVAGAGVAVLYVATYAAFSLYALISRPARRAGVLINGLAAALADRQRSQALALMAVGGGFATPFLLPGESDAQFTLFSYQAILIAGTMYLAGRREWPALNIVSYAFTALTVSAWATRFFRPSKYLSTELFLTLFCAMYLYILVRTRRGSGSLVRLAENVLWTAPVFYYLVSVAILADHAVALLIYLIALAVVGAALGRRFGSVVRAGSLAAVVVPLLLWAGTHASRSWLALGLAAVYVVCAIFLAAHFDWTLGANAALAPADMLVIHLNGLSAFGGAYLLLEPSMTAAAIVAAVSALWHGALARWLLARQRGHALHFAALGFTLLMIAIALRFNGAWLTVGWAAEGAAVAALGLRERRGWMRAGGALLFAVAIARLLWLQLGAPSSDYVVLLNRRAGAAAFLIALAYWLAWLHHRVATTATEVAIGVITAQVLTFTMLTSEIVAFWAVHGARPDRPFASQLTLSVTWGLFATVLIVVGIQRRYPPIRYFAILVFAVTITKVFGFDLAALDRVYRIASIIGLGTLLLATSYLYQRFRDTA